MAGEQGVTQEQLAAAIQQAMAPIQSSIQALAGAMQSGGSTGGSGQKATQQQAAFDPEKVRLGMDTSNLEQMSRAELTDTIIRETLRVVHENMFMPLRDYVTTNVNSTARTTMQSQITAMKEKHKDFSEWNSEMSALAKEHPNLSLQRLYNLSRSENPDKAKQMDEKYAASSPEPGKDKGGKDGKGSKDGDTSAQAAGDKSGSSGQGAEGDKSKGGKNGELPPGQPPGGSAGGSKQATGVANVRDAAEKAFLENFGSAQIVGEGAQPGPAAGEGGAE